jgi:hypothetical protein
MITKHMVKINNKLEECYFLLEENNDEGDREIERKYLKYKKKYLLLKKVSKK